VVVAVVGRTEKTRNCSTCCGTWHVALADAKSKGCRLTAARPLCAAGGQPRAGKSGQRGSHMKRPNIYLVVCYLAGIALAAKTVWDMHTHHMSIVDTVLLAYAVFAMVALLFGDLVNKFADRDENTPTEDDRYACPVEGCFVSVSVSDADEASHLHVADWVADHHAHATATARQ
jgi:hypothetical protein